ncbi:glycosyltransferase [Demequina sp. NBRC 110051]|uniref:glycosyltransferase n=1 Tax=Demequina sp. NBRC 110051 TaxID=1570340 RepID=UPI000A0644CD|nr:glycosyltransferase [Demequina sp. NBRC 110051]
MTGLIVHEWFEHHGGAEKVLKAMADTFPQAAVRVLWSDVEAPLGPRLVSESWIARTALRRSKVAALPFMPITWRARDYSQGHDWMLVSSHLFAHHARSRGIPKYVYAHTPARYIWEPSGDGRGNSAAARAASALLRPLDRQRAREAIAIAANSEYVRQRIRRTWGRDATVIYPPVAVERLQVGTPWRDKVAPLERARLSTLAPEFIFGASRFVPYKRLDAVIAAGEELGMPVVLAGRGPDEARLRSIAVSARVPVEFVVAPSDEMLFALFEAAAVFVFPPTEDFGIVPVEAMALGTPVIASKFGGAGESVLRCDGGALVDPDVEGEWTRAWREVQEVDRIAMQDAARYFDDARFSAELAEWIGAPTFEDGVPTESKDQG